MNSKDNFPLLVTPEALEYLVLQRGALDDMRGDMNLWIGRYAEAIEQDFHRIGQYLPKKCESILDVGSGLGGIDALLNWHYGGECRVTLVDGVDDPPVMELHRKTFNSMAVARRFLEANGVKYFSFIDANDAHRVAGIKYDLIVSCKSWCFHIPPETHLDLVLSAVHDDTRMIIDVRADKRDWLQSLLNYFDGTCIYRGGKGHTWVFWRKPP